MKKYNQLVGLLFLLLSWLFTGIYRDEEFYELNLFFKYRPTFKIWFYSPIGMEDKMFERLSSTNQKEEIAYQDFVVNHKIIYNNSSLGLMPLLFIQCSLTHFAFGLIRNPVNFWQSLIHFFLNIFISTYILIIMLDKNIWKILALLLLLTAVNFIAAFIISYLRKT